MVTSAHVKFTPEPDTLDFLQDTTVIDLSNDTLDTEQQPAPASEVASDPTEQMPDINQQQGETSEATNIRNAPRPSKLVKPTPSILH